MIRLFALLSMMLLVACQSTPRNVGPNFPAPGQGQYVRPDYLNPVPPPLITPDDTCGARLYQGLVGQSEGAIYFPALQGAKRVIKPAYDEGDNGLREAMGLPPTFLEVRDYLPGQNLYTSSIRTPGNLQSNGDTDLTRLTVELDTEGYVFEIRCG